MHIEDFIPFGRKNAISRYDLSYSTGLSDRHVRNAISLAKKRVPIVSMDDGSGYYQPTGDDYDFVIGYYNREKHRREEISKNIKTIRKWITSQSHKRTG